MKVDLVVFDMAGTTVVDGDAVHRCLMGALEANGTTVTRAEVNEVMGLSKHLALRLLLERHTPDDEAVSDDRVCQIYGDFANRILQHYASGPGVREVEGVSDLFARLRKAGVRVALDTGFDREVADVIIGRLGWQSRGLLDATVTSDEVDFGRPQPDMIYRAMRLTGVRDPQKVAKVGDTPADLREGAAAGCGLVVGVLNGSHTRDELIEHPHTHLVPTVVDIPRLVLDKTLFTPGPLTTSRTVKEAMLRDLGTRDYEFVGLVRRVRLRLLSLAGLFQEDGFEAVPIQGPGTYAVESVISSVVPPESALLVCVNGAYGERMVRVAEMLRIPVIALRYPEHTVPNAEDVRSILANKPGVSHVAMVHCETTSGILNPIEEIGQVVREAERAFIVDAMSSFGAYPIDFEAAGIDYLISSANKCLEGVPGIGFVIARRSAIVSSAGCARSHSFDLLDQWRALEQEGQFRFTPPTHAIIALDRALRELDEEGGVRARAARYGASHRALVSGMLEMGFRPYVAPEHQSYIITAFHNPTHPRFVFEEFYRLLSSRGFVVYAGKVSNEDTFRIGNIGHIGPEDIHELLRAIRGALDYLGIDTVDAPSPVLFESLA